MLKCCHFFSCIFAIFQSVFLLYGEKASKKLTKVSKEIWGSSDFFSNQTRQLFTLGAGEKAFAGTVFR